VLEIEFQQVSCLEKRMVKYGRKHFVVNKTFRVLCRRPLSVSANRNGVWYKVHGKRENVQADSNLQYGDF